MFIWAAAAMAVATLLAAPPSVAKPTRDLSKDTTAIREVITAYERAQDAGDFEKAARLYADDGVLMPPNHPSIVGEPAIHAAYEEGSKIFRLDIKFAILEAVRVAPQWAFVRTTSIGSMKILATGNGMQEANQELFILRKIDTGEWRIARYSFSSTNPGP